jgi:uncharacterized OsmC-like protein
MMTIMGIVANRSGLDLTSTTFSVTKHMTSDPRRIAQIDIDFRMPATLSAKDRAVLENAARTCPVALSLNPEIRQQVHFSYES